MRVVACVQCRMGSSRLPGKALMDLGGKPVIEHVFDRTHAAKLVDEVVLATTWDEEDDQLAAWARNYGFRHFEGSPTDVLSRIRQAAEWAKADVVVRVTGDCPMLEPDVIDQVVDALGHADFASNCIRRTFAKGLDCEAMHLDTLRRIDRLAISEKARASVTWFAYVERPDLFVIESVTQGVDHSHIDLCVDTAEDLERLRSLVTA